MTSGRRAGKRGASWARVGLWSVAAALLLAPLIAMQFTDQVAWSGADFAVFGALLLTAGGAFDLAIWARRNAAYRAGAAVALVGAVLMIWVSGAVGVIGSEDNPANLLFAGVLAVPVIGALIARFRPRGMSGVLAATAVAQAGVGVAALAAGWGAAASAWPLDVIGATVAFTVLWLTAAWLFRVAARPMSAAAAAA